MIFFLPYIISQYYIISISFLVQIKKKIMKFDGKVILITGASSGIGAGTAEFFAARGAILAITGRNVDNLNSVAKKCTELSESSHKPLTIIADGENEIDAKRTIDVTIKFYGKLDVLVNCAGILLRGSIETGTLADFDKVMNTNVRAILCLTQLAVPHLLKTKGNIVNVSSVTGIRAFPNVLAYNMSKAAIDQFTRCTALELAPKGIRVNSVNPGVIVTEVHKRGGMDDKDYEKFLEHSKSTHALGRSGNVEEVASAIAYLASDYASFITGVQLPIDGGRHLMT